MSDSRDFSGQTIEDVDFAGADLTNAKFKNAFVKNCDFTAAKLIHAALDAADFEGCSFHGVSFKRWYFDGAPTTAHARFVDCDFTGADFEDRDLTNVRFVRCKLAGVEPKSPRTIDGVVLVECDVDRDAFAQRLGVRPMPAAGVPAKYLLEAEMFCADLRQRWRVSTVATFDHHPTREEIERALSPEAERILGEGYAYDFNDFVVKAG